MNGYIQALNNGSEIVIISNDTNSDSAIFWKSNGTYYTFCRAFEVMKRTDMTDERFLEHIKNMGKAGAQFFIRGYRD